jgi:hypothetical protein
MKKLLLSIAIMASTILSAQNMTPVTRAEFNEINLKLEKVDRFGRQHRLGNKVALLGVLTTVSGVVVLQNDYTIKNRIRNWISTYYTSISNPKTNRLGRNITLVGLGITTVGLTINISSYKHLKLSPKKRLSISFK